MRTFSTIMISIFTAFFVFVSLVAKGTIRNDKIVEKLRIAFREEGKEIMGSALFEMRINPKRFVESEESEKLRKRGIKLLKEYKATNIHPLKIAALTLGVCLVIEFTVGYFAFKSIFKEF